MHFYFFRYLKEKNYPASIVRHDAFWSSRQVLEGKARIARMDGKGNVPNRERSLSGAEENIIRDSGHLSCNSFRSLIQTVWWNNCLHFGLTGRKEHHSLKIKQFGLQIDENGRRYISYTEGLSKTGNERLNFKPRLISPNMYENKTERCSVAFFLLFKSKRPVELQNMSPFYLSVIDACLTDVWYKNQVMRVNTINTTLNRMKKSHH